MSVTAADRPNVQLRGPYDSLRDYVAALEALGRLVRIEEMDQDRFEATAFAYRLIEKHGFYGAPAFLIERIKVDGKWLDGPVISNLYGGWDTEAMSFGVEEVTTDQNQMYQATLRKLASQTDDNGQFNKIKPVTIKREHSPCKEVIVVGDDVNILQYPWLQSNPGDAGRYINAASIIMEDSDLGRNVSTQRFQVKSRNKVGVNLEGFQHGGFLLMAAKRRGEKTAKAAIVMGVDPIIFSLSSSKIAKLGEDELELAGGLKGKPVELVKCETNDIMVPAHAEMILEGEIPLDDKEEEGPFAEIYGYMGMKVPNNYYMNIVAVTHRRNPWFINSFAGVTKLHHAMPSATSDYLKHKRMIPSLVAYYTPREATGIAILSVKKRLSGVGMTAGLQAAASGFLAKVIIVVDEDVDIFDLHKVLHAVGSRWQPNDASLIIPKMAAMPLDPSSPIRGLTSKIIIDATKQFPEEGGPPSWPAVSRQLLEEACPQLFDLIDSKWDEYWKDFEQ